MTLALPHLVLNTFLIHAGAVDALGEALFPGDAFRSLRSLFIDRRGAL